MRGVVQVLYGRSGASAIWEEWWGREAHTAQGVLKHMQNWCFKWFIVAQIDGFASNKEEE